MSSISGGGEAYIRNISKPLLDFFDFKGKHKLFFLAHKDQYHLLSEVPSTNIIWIKKKRPLGPSRIFWEKNTSTASGVGGFCH